jgi:hypothetical protein
MNGLSVFENLNATQKALLKGEIESEQERRNAILSQKTRTFSDIILVVGPLKLGGDNGSRNLTLIKSLLGAWRRSEEEQACKYANVKDEWAYLTFDTAEQASYVKRQFTNANVFDKVNYLVLKNDTDRDEDESAELTFFKSLSNKQLAEWSALLNHSSKYKDTRPRTLIVSPVNGGSVTESRDVVIDAIQRIRDANKGSSSSRSIYVSPSNVREAQIHFYTPEDCAFYAEKLKDAACFDSVLEK